MGVQSGYAIIAAGNVKFSAKDLVNGSTIGCATAVSLGVMVLKVAAGAGVIAIVIAIAIEDVIVNLTRSVVASHRCSTYLVG
jgi:hypothetical protein